MIFTWWKAGFSRKPVECDILNTLKIYSTVLCSYISYIEIYRVSTPNGQLKPCQLGIPFFTKCHTSCRLCPIVGLCETLGMPWYTTLHHL
jgi:hypothetical protein